MKLKKEILLVILLANFFIIHSQTTELTKKDSTIVSSWIAGIGFNAVDDSDDTFGKLFDFKGAWNAVPYPSRVSIGKYFKSGLGLEGIASYNKYKKGKIVDGLPLTSDKNYYSVDSRLSYDLNKIVGETGWFDPYVGVGLGYTHSNDNSRGTYNAVFGFRAWFSERFGLDVNTSGKWTMNNYTNHIQHVVGVVYRFNIKKELTEAGKEKLKLIEAEKKELARVNDSIISENKIAEEKRMLAERMEKEKEIQKIEAIKIQQKEKDENDIQNKLNALEPIYFALDSSNLNSSSKNILSKLISILDEYPKLVIEVNSHTDSRGSNKYNQNLSERRMKSTLDYLIKNGVESKRLIGQGFGEEKLVNECDDHTKCSEIKHKQNRRSEFKIISF